MEIHKLWMYNGRKALGQRIKEERIKMFLTQEQLAEKVGISRLYITFIQKGNRSVRVEMLKRIADS
jgi:transcriptional regulator with XRE-family HTH domain